MPHNHADHITAFALFPELRLRKFIPGALGPRSREDA